MPAPDLVSSRAGRRGGAAGGRQAAAWRRCRRRIRKTAILVFAAGGLYITIRFNLSLLVPGGWQLPIFLAGTHPPAYGWDPIASANRAILDVDGFLARAGRGLRIENPDGAFAVPIRSNKITIRHVALRRSGREELLPDPSDRTRSFLQRQFVDFREVRFRETVDWLPPQIKRLFLRSLCRAVKDHGDPVVRIRRETVVQWILPPDDALRAGTRYRRTLDVYPEEVSCAD